MGSNKSKPFPPGDIPGAVILGVERDAPLLERYVYRVRFPICGHEDLLIHRTIRNRIRLGYSTHEYTGLCPSCSRTSTGQELARSAAPRRKTKKQLTEEDMRGIAHNAFNIAMRKCSR